jgi:hypothetical protein
VIETTLFSPLTAKLVTPQFLTALKEYSDYFYKINLPIWKSFPSFENIVISLSA